MQTPENITQYIEGIIQLGAKRRLCLPYERFQELFVVFDPASADPSAKRGTIKECFRNAACRAIAHDHLIYCEGFAVSRVVSLPVQHAWIYNLQTNKIMEVTWPKDGAEYAGIPFDKSFLAKQCVASGFYGNLIFKEDFLNAEDFTSIFHPSIKNLNPLKNYTNGLI